MHTRDGGQSLYGSIRLPPLQLHDTHTLRVIAHENATCYSNEVSSLLAALFSVSLLLVAMN
jgi:hypothetical protein